MRKVLLLLAALAALSACAPAKGGLKPVSLVLDWYPNAVHSFILAAEEQGFFRAEGLDVTIKMPAENPTDGIKLVGAGKETFALYYQPDVLVARGESIPIVSVAAVVRHPLNGIIVREESGITSPKDLAGKSVGYPGIPLNLPMVNTMVKAAGGDPATVTMTDISWDLIPALATKRTDAIAGGFLNHEKLILEQEGTRVRYFAPQAFGVPNYYELVLITGEETARKDAATIQAFWRALSKGHDWVKSHQADALKLLLAKQEKSFPLDAKVEEASLNLLLPMMEEEGTPFGAQSADDWTKVGAWLKEHGAVKADVNPADAFVSIIK